MSHSSSASGPLQGSPFCYTLPRTAYVFFTSPPASCKKIIIKQHQHLQHFLTPDPTFMPCIVFKDRKNERCSQWANSVFQCRTLSLPYFAGSMAFPDALGEFCPILSGLKLLSRHPIPSFLANSHSSQDKLPQAAAC